MLTTHIGYTSLGSSCGEPTPGVRVVVQGSNSDGNRLSQVSSTPSMRNSILQKHPLLEYRKKKKICDYHGVMAGGRLQEKIREDRV